jgi:ribokinase
MSVVVFGSLNLDLVAYAQVLPTLGQTVTGEKLLRFPGGKGLNQAIAAKRSGSQVKMIGALGADAEGEFLRQILNEEEIDSSSISAANEQTGIAVIEVAKDAQNRILIIPGANATVKFDKSQLLSQSKSQSNNPKVCLAQLETPIIEVTKFLLAGKELNCTTILNPAPVQKLDLETIKACDYLVVNESEASFLAGNTVDNLTPEEAKQIAQKLLSNGSKKVIITMAEKGSLFLATEGEQQEIYTPAYKVNAVDTTAAGDAFCGALATAFAKNYSISDSLKFASAAGALATTKAGAVPSIPSQTEINKLIANN